MADKAWQPKWWSDETHGSSWERVKDAMKRDWEQTKSDLGAGGRELDQDVDDTVKQAAGKDVIPPAGTPNAPGGTPASWEDAEGPTRYGHAARSQYGDKHPSWDDKLETTLRTEWDEAKDTTRKAWQDVKSFVRRGYDRAKS
jgi:hypothetical protein